MNLRLQYNEKTNKFYIEEEVIYFFDIFTKWEVLGSSSGSVAGIYFEPYSYNTSTEAKKVMCEMISVDASDKKAEASRIAKNLKDNEANGNFELSTDEFIIGKCDKIKDK